MSFGEDGGEYKCIILDMSDLGAKVSLELPVPTPECFDLKVIDGENYRCRRVWQDDDALGVEFIETRERDYPTDPEPRRDKRMAVLRRGRIIFNGGYCTMDCHILDLSEGGARIRPVDPVSCPEVFKLSVEFGPSRACKIVRSEGEDIGVQFLDRPEAK